jgi:hypothetical protein
MQTVLEPRAREVLRPLDIVDTQNKSKFEFAIDILEREVLQHITSQANAGEMLNVSYLRNLFYHAKAGLRK